MICKNCGSSFEEGIFCPECGTKCESGNTSNQNNTVIEQRHQIAHSILDEFECVEDEKLLIDQLGWPNSKDIIQRIAARIEIYHKAVDLNVKTDAAQKKIVQMEQDIKDDYYKYKRDGEGVIPQAVWAIIITIGVLWWWEPTIFRTLIGLLLFGAAWGAVIDIIVHKMNFKKLDKVFKKL